MSDVSTLNALLLAVIGGLIAGIGWLVKHERERREEIENQVSEKKYLAYMTLINIFFEVLNASKTGEVLADLPKRMIDANKALLVFGTDEVFLSYQAWTHSSSEGQKAMLHKFGNVILAIRRDMGNPKTKVSSDDVLRSFIIDFDEMREKDLI